MSALFGGRTAPRGLLLQSRTRSKCILCSASSPVCLIGECVRVLSWRLPGCLSVCLLLLLLLLTVLLAVRLTVLLAVLLTVHLAVLLTVLLTALLTVLVSTSLEILRCSCNCAAGCTARELFVSWRLGALSSRRMTNG